MNTSLDLARYLSRIHYVGPLDPTAATLRAIHQAHMMSVPFENLEINPLGLVPSLDPDDLFDKIVNQRRGGFCYELNGLFSLLLRELGFDVTLVSARVENGPSGWGPEFDHLALIVQLDERYLADVGFGSSFNAPLRLDYDGEQSDDGRGYQITRDGEVWMMSEHLPGEDWKGQYIFTLAPRDLADFAEMCRRQATTPGGYFVTSAICSRTTLEGRITLRDLKLTITQNGTKIEHELADDSERNAVLREHFGIALV